MFASPVILCGPLVIYLRTTAWQRSSSSKRLVTSIVAAAMAVVSFEALYYISEFWIIRLLFVAVFWLMNIPAIALIVVLRRSDRLVREAARDLERKSTRAPI